MSERSIRDRYVALLKAYAATQGEEFLTKAQEVGRELVTDGVPTEEIAEMQEEALRRLAEESPNAISPETIPLISAPLMEMLMAYGLAFREQIERLAKERERERELEENKRLMKDLARSNQELEQFAYIASHDLQEPLRMVTSYVELLAQRYQGQLDAKADKYIAYAVEGTMRMRQLISDLLTFSRVGKQQKPHTAVPTSEIVDQTLADLEVAIQESRGVVTRADLPTVSANRGQMSQLFGNLIGNGLKFRTDEPPRIHVGAERNGQAWVFSVRDNGIGMDTQFYERIFRAFQRLHERGKYPGTGIGLAIAKKIVEQHGGSIWVESELGKGATFFLHSRTQKPIKEGDMMHKPIQILLVEDNPADVDLTREGFEVGKLKNDLHVVTDGIEAMGFLRKEGEHASAPRPDLILLDLNLPKKDGREVLGEIKQDPGLQTIPVVVLTSSDAEEDVLKSYQLHANSYIRKPVNLERFMNVVSTVEDFWFSVVKLPGN